MVGDKWLATVQADVTAELNRVTGTLTGRVRELAERYAEPLPVLAQNVDELQARVNVHLERMGFTWA